MAHPALTDEEKQKSLRQMELPDDEWEPIQLPEGAEPISVTVIKMQRGECVDSSLPREKVMLPKVESKREVNEPPDWQDLTQFWLDEMLADPDLTDEQKQQLLEETELPEEEWKLPEFPEGAEPLSVTVIKMRRGE